MVKISNGIFEYVKSYFRDLEIEMYLQSHINQLTVYIESEITNEEFSYLKTMVMKYIGDNRMGGTYSTVKYFR